MEPSILTVGDNSQANNDRSLQLQIRLEQSKREREEKLKDIKEQEREHKAEDEDWETIDLKFNKECSEIELELMSWQENISDTKDKEAVQKYFDGVFGKYQQLREYVNNYTFAIPVANFSTY